MRLLSSHPRAWPKAVPERNDRILASCLKAVTSLPFPNKSIANLPSSNISLQLLSSITCHSHFPLSYQGLVLYHLWKANCFSSVAARLHFLPPLFPSTEEHTQKTNKEGEKKTKRQITVQREINDPGGQRSGSRADDQEDLR